MRSLPGSIRVAAAILMLTIAAWISTSFDSDPELDVDGMRHGQRRDVKLAPSTLSESEMEIAQIESEGLGEGQSQSQRHHRIADAFAAAAPQGRKLLKDWEERSFRPITFANTLMAEGDNPAAAVVVPRPDDETEHRLRQLLVFELGDLSIRSL